MPSYRKPIAHNLWTDKLQGGEGNGYQIKPEFYSLKSNRGHYEEPDSRPDTRASKQGSRRFHNQGYGLLDIGAKWADAKVIKVQVVWLA